MKNLYECTLTKGLCEYGGNKAFNYGFMSGSACYCRLKKRFTVDMKICPKIKDNHNE
jgi:hypothetical protein